MYKTIYDVKVVLTLFLARLVFKIAHTKQIRMVIEANSYTLAP